MAKSLFIKIGGAVVTVAIIILGITLPTTEWISKNTAVRISVITIIALVLGGLLWLLGVWLSRREMANRRPDDNGVVLLNLLDDSYHRLKEITRQTIRHLRKRDWQDFMTASHNLMWLTDMDVQEAIERIMIENVYRFMTGQPLTVDRESTNLAEKINKSPLFTRNPEEIASDASVILKEKVPYLKKKMDKDRLFKKLQNEIEKERNKFPNDDVSKAISEYKDHAIKINAAWILSTHDLDNMPIIEDMIGKRFPLKFKVILWGLPGRMDEEMTQRRMKVAVAILNYRRELQ